MGCVSSMVAANVPLSKTGASRFLSMFTVKIAALVRGGLPPSCANTRTLEETNCPQELEIYTFHVSCQSQQCVPKAKLLRLSL